MQQNDDEGMAKGEWRLPILFCRLICRDLIIIWLNMQMLSPQKASKNAHKYLYAKNKKEKKFIKQIASDAEPIWLFEKSKTYNFQR